MGPMSERYVETVFTYQLILSVLLVSLVEHLGVCVCANFASYLGGIGGLEGPPVFTPHAIYLGLIYWYYLPSPLFSLEFQL